MLWLYDNIFSFRLLELLCRIPRRYKVLAYLGANNYFSSFILYELHLLLDNTLYTFFKILIDEYVYLNLRFGISHKCIIV